MTTYQVELHLKKAPLKTLRASGTNYRKEAKELLQWAKKEGWTPKEFEIHKIVEILAFGTSNYEITKLPKKELPAVA